APEPRPPGSRRGSAGIAGKMPAVPALSLFWKWQLLARRQLHLEDVEGVPDQRVVADDRDDLDYALLAECRDRLVEARIRQALAAENLVADAIDQRLVVGVKDRCAAGADRLYCGMRHPR